MYNNNMKFILKNLFVMIFLTFIFLSPVLSLAVDVNGDLSNNNPSATSVTINNPIPSITTVDGFIKTILVGVIKIGLPIVALAIIYSGFLFVSARGKPEALKKAKDAFLYSLIGAAILLGSWALAQLISDTVTKLG
jgi:hypothetical protein